MNMQKLDTDTLREIRDMSLQSLTDASRELDRRLDVETEALKVDMIPLSQLARHEGITPDGMKKRCDRKGIPLVDKEGNKSSAGRRAYVNLNLYKQKY